MATHYKINDKVLIPATILSAGTDKEDNMFYYVKEFPSIGIPEAIIRTSDEIIKTFQEKTGKVIFKAENRCKFHRTYSYKTEILFSDFIDEMQKRGLTIAETKALANGFKEEIELLLKNLEEVTCFQNCPSLD